MNRHGWWVVSRGRHVLALIVLHFGNICWACKIIASDIVVLLLVPWPILLFGLKGWLALTIAAFLSWLLLIALTTIVKVVGFAIWRRQHRGMPTDLPESFVLYLRPFAHDSNTVPPPADPFRRGFEGHIADAFAPLPIIALRSGGFVWETPGMAWITVGKDEWQMTITELASRASTILLLLGDSPNLLWEVDLITARVPPHRVILLVRRQKKPDQEATVSNIELPWEDNEVTRTRYRTFQKLFPHRLPDYRPGTIFVTFGENWETPELCVDPSPAGTETFSASMRTLLMSRPCRA